MNDETLVGVITIGLDPVLAHIGPLAVHWYGLMYALGIAAGLRVALPYVRDRHIATQDAVTIVWGTGLAALVGGRLYFVAQTHPRWYFAHPAQILATWQGGMAFYGALALGVPTLMILAHVRSLSAGILLDSAALLAPVAQGIGRIGNLINGDVLGYPSTLPWATIYTNPHSFAPIGIPYEPASLYEFLVDAVIFAILWGLSHHERPRGTLFLLYLPLYALSQFVVFYWRNSPLVAFNLKQAQITSLVVLAVVAPLLVWQYRRIDRTPSAPAKGPDRQTTFPPQ